MFSRLSLILLVAAVAFAHGASLTRGPHRSLLQNAPTSDGPQAAVGVLPPLPYATEALEPFVDNATTAIHWSRHFNAFVVNLRFLVGNNTQLAQYNLAQLQRLSGTGILNGTAATTLINNGGGAWNHAFFFKSLTLAGTPQAQYDVSASNNLKGAINAAFGNFTAFQTQFSAAANGVFGSGWAWLVATDSGLKITTTPNQNNPLQTALANSTRTTVGIPILGIDVWEHAYYLKYQNVRASWVSNFFYVINWIQISENYVYAAAGQVPSTAPGPLATQI